MAAPCPYVNLSSSPQGGLTTVALPFMALTKLGTEKDSQDTVELMLRAMAAAVWNLARTLRPRKLEGASLMMFGHKMEVKEDHGDLWFNKACSSSRDATCVLNRDLK